MKKTTRFLVFVALSAGLLMAGCESDDNGGNTSVEWVDLGLPSGLLWANCNVGATKPEEYGGYFAWGETTPKNVYNWSTYRYCTVDGEGVLTTLTKYNTLAYYGTVDNLTTLEPSDDAATVNLGAGARTPTIEEWQELINNTISEWTTLNGVYGRMLTGPNGNSIFLPAAGFHLRGAGIYGYYWSSSLYTDAPYFARSFNFNSTNQAVVVYYRLYDHSVRAVRASQD